MNQRLVMGMTAAAMLAASGMAMAEPSWRLAGTIGMRQFVVVDPAVSTDAAMLKQAANTVCVTGRACVVVFWSDAAAVPKTMPMTRAQQDSVVAQYFRNPASGSDELLLKCQAGQTDGQKCLR